MGVRRPRLRAQSLESRACVSFATIRVEHTARDSLIHPAGSALVVRLAQARLVSRPERVRLNLQLLDEAASRNRNQGAQIDEPAHRSPRRDEWNSEPRE